MGREVQAWIVYIICPAKGRKERRGEEWVGKERMNGGQSIHICEWAPVYRNREWHFFSGLVDSSI